MKTPDRFLPFAEGVLLLSLLLLLVLPGCCDRERATTGTDAPATEAARATHPAGDAATPARNGDFPAGGPRASGTGEVALREGFAPASEGSSAFPLLKGYSTSLFVRDREKAVGAKEAERAEIDTRARVAKLDVNFQDAAIRAAVQVVAEALGLHRVDFADPGAEIPGVGTLTLASRGKTPAWAITEFEARGIILKLRADNTVSVKQISPAEVDRRKRAMQSGLESILDPKPAPR